MQDTTRFGMVKKAGTVWQFWQQKKLKKAVELTDIKNVCIAGGVSANSELRKQLQTWGETNGWQTFIPRFEFCTDNAAMIVITAYYKYLKGDFAGLDIVPAARPSW